MACVKINFLSIQIHTNFAISYKNNPIKMQKQSSKVQKLKEQLNKHFDLFHPADTKSLDTFQMTNLFNYVFERIGERIVITPDQGRMLMLMADNDMDGRCSKDELFVLIAKLDQMKDNSSKFKEAFEAKGSSKDQYTPPTLNMDEQTFNKVMVDVKKFEANENPTEQEYADITDKIISYFDKDKSGSLETSEMINFMRAVDADKGKLRGESEFTLNMIVSTIDPNNDGKITRAEFIQFMKQVNQFDKKKKLIDQKMPGLYGDTKVFQMPSYTQSDAKCPSVAELMQQHNQSQQNSGLPKGFVDPKSLEIKGLQNPYPQPKFPTYEEAQQQMMSGNSQIRAPPSWYYYPEVKQRVVFSYNKPF